MTNNKQVIDSLFNCLEQEINRAIVKSDAFRNFVELLSKMEVMDQFINVVHRVSIKYLIEEIQKKGNEDNQQINSSNNSFELAGQSHNQSQKIDGKILSEMKSNFRSNLQVSLTAGNGWISELSGRLLVYEGTSNKENTSGFMSARNMNQTQETHNGKWHAMLITGDDDFHRA